MPSANLEARAKRAREGPKKTTGGNTIPDREWLAACIEAGEITKITPRDRPAGVVDDVMYVWEGYADELNIDFFESFRRPRADGQDRRCNGTAYVRDERGGYVLDVEWNRIRRPCLSHPARGTIVCHAHGAKIPAVKAKAQQVLAEASEAVALRLVGLTLTADEDGDAIEHKVRLAAMNSVLDRAGIKGGVEVEVTLPGYKKIMSQLFGAEDEGGD